ncbi:peptidyl-prolyl cis-trans isomerase FKBP53 isoform X2 [Primulina huaijiensis]|uniref:peptidyl-prolyl cis-trans isomerase FKBP53 isoform X2 n=1 Tax=Primulina huaijiensis TaxID=1492673 RepID=UPI003CC6F1B5
MAKMKFTVKYNSFKTKVSCSRVLGDFEVRQTSAMAFWGIEIKPGKPYIHRYDDENGRLHVSQATLGAVSSTKKSIVQCKVGDKNPIYLCSLLPERIETCALNLEFKEDDDVTFSVNGPHTVHLSGFFFGEDEDQDNIGDDYGSDLYEGNIVGSDSEDEDDSDDDGEYDDLIEDDLGMFPSSPIPNSGVKIEEIVDGKEITNEIGLSKQGRKKKNQSDISDHDGSSNHQIVVKAGSGVPVLESEDEDGFPVISARESKFDFSNSASKSGKTCERMDDKTKRKNETDEVACGKIRKRKNDSLGQDREPDRDNDEPRGSSVQPDEIVPKNDVKKNKKKKVSEKEDSGKESGTLNSNAVEKLPEGEIGNDLGPNKKKKKEKKKKKQSKEGESAVSVKVDQTLTNGKGSSMGKEEKEKSKSSQVRTFPNGLAIEEVSMGKPNGKRASPGTKVSVLYIGKLKNGKIFDSNIGRAPFKFRLGIGQVIKGWDVGVNGMRIGDKRRLTIPPAMGYGAKGCGPAIPPNSWLVFDVELVDVN